MVFFPFFKAGVVENILSVVGRMILTNHHRKARKRKKSLYYIKWFFFVACRNFPPLQQPLPTGKNTFYTNHLQPGKVVGDLNIFYSLGDSGVFITLWPWHGKLAAVFWALVLETRLWKHSRWGPLKHGDLFPATAKKLGDVSDFPKLPRVCLKTVFMEIFSITHGIYVWHIYLHEWLFFMVNVGRIGKYTSPMDPSWENETNYSNKKIT